MTATDLVPSAPPYLPLPSAPKAKRRRRQIKALIRRDGDRCFYCRRQFPREAYTLDHFVPRSKGGLDQMANLRLACRSCNHAKADRMPDECVWRTPSWMLLSGWTPVTPRSRARKGQR